ncbi:carbon-nitrogen hydrolase family protein [Neisseria flava]|uniref:carbon-nitrogen hydrolase family protein n=1 Tax=Neisseria sicca TaxID=490 RepID=UPI0008A33EA8|nr:carbon-nitrogen hydrolase family protein [Neisseria sicca]MBY6284716.1 carbon-nitrogen hydrolase family protein [Neisseria flava]OFJ78023.1 acyltransferase [Neisseria sp. HMSC072F04]QTM23305.1 carbon-nitrogen hydrolase family protein [Neisseria sicca]
MQKNIRAAAVQMISSTNPDANIDTMKRLVRQAAEQGADWVLLPEYWPLMGRKDTDKLAFAEPLVGSNFSETRYARFGETRCARFQTTLSETAAECGVVLFGGTIPLESPDAGKVMNTMLVYDRDGTQIGLYHKMHLFGFSGLGERYAEADTISAGGDVPKLTADGVPLAAGVCYDLRFPEFFRAQQPFDVLLLPAAFTYTTGKAHWELLLRARAVENQCYVIASAQGGEHESGRRTFGHSMIIDPWGEILDVLPEGEGIVISDLDAARLQSVRTRLPALKHRLL